MIADLLAAHRGYQVIGQLPGIGPVLAAVIIAEIGDDDRFKNAGQLCSWAGLTPRHREPGTKVTRGHVTKQGSPILRWALIEAIGHQPPGSRPRAAKDAIIARRGTQARNIAKVAAARQLLTLVLAACATGRSAPWPASQPSPPPSRPHDQLFLLPRREAAKLSAPAVTGGAGRELE